MNGIDFKGKNYVMVNSRVTAFRKLFPEGFIITDMVSNEGGVCVMQARVGYYQDGNPFVLGTGMAFEKQDSTYINKTSYIENCETSAVGRALGFLALGADDSICSAEELVNAVTNQGDFPKKVTSKEDAPKKFEAPKKQETKAKVETVAKVPEPKPKNPVQEFIANEISFMKQMFGISDTGEMVKKFMEMRQSLIDAKIVEDVPSDKQTMEQAEAMIDAIYKNFMTDKKEDK